MKTKHLHLSSMRICLWMRFEVLLMVTCKGASHSLCWIGAHVLQEPAVSIQWWRQHVLPEIDVPGLQPMNRGVSAVGITQADVLSRMDTTSMCLEVTAPWYVTMAIFMSTNISACEEWSLAVLQYSCQYQPELMNDQAVPCLSVGRDVRCSATDRKMLCCSPAVP